ncbi:MAG TPA: TonB-dependent receptor [Acidobacteriaceae bacterium]
MSLTSIKAPSSVSALAAAILSLAAPALHAQQVPQNSATAASAIDQGATSIQAPSAAVPAAADADALQEIVVTANRRAVSLQETPTTVTAIKGEQLQSLHINLTSDLQTTVPGFQSQNEGGQFLQNNIRGIGVEDLVPQVQIGVKTVLDGIVQDINIGLDQPLYDMADVEVLEGPQGTFAGASAIGGAILLNTANPNFDGLNGYVQAGYGTYQDIHLQGAINLPVSDTLALRLAFNAEQEHSFYNDIGASPSGYYFTSYSATAPQTDGPPHPLNQGSIGSGGLIDPGAVDNHQVRIKALWKPTDNFQSLSTISYSSSVTGGQPAEPNPGTYQNLFAYPGGCSTVAGTTFTGNQLVCTGAGATTQSTFYYPGEKPFVLDYYGTAQQYSDFSYQISEEARYTLPDGIVLRSLTGYFHMQAQSQSNISYGPQNAGWLYKPQGPDYLPSEEFDIISPTTGKLSWIAGAYYEYRYAPVPQSQLSVGAPYQPYTAPTTDSVLAVSGATGRAGAVFGQLNWQFTDTLQLQFGARENWDDNSASNPFNVAPAVGTVLPAPDGTGTYSILNTAAACGTLAPPCYKVLGQNTTTGRYYDAVPTGKVDLNWTPLPGQNFYVFYARGYAGGGVNAGSTDHLVFKPETVNDWEAGWKGRLFDGHMLTQIGLYYERVQNYQYPIEDTEANNDTSVGSYVGNFAPSLIEGVSAAAQARFGGLGLDLAFDYNHTSLGNVQTVNNSAFPAGFGSPLANPQCVAGHTYTAPLQCFDYTPYLTNVSGEPNPFAPEIQANIAVDYKFNIGLGTLDPRVTYDYTSKQYGAIFETSYNELGKRSIVGASLDWVVGKWDTQLYSTNLTNETYITANAGSTVYYGPPRQYGIQVSYRF